MNTLMENKIRQIAGRMLEITCYLNKADHVDVKTFVSHCGAEADRAKLVELHSLYMELSSIEELAPVLNGEVKIELDSVEDIACIAMCECCDYMMQLQEDIASKLEGKSRNTYYSAEENYQIAQWFNKGFAAKTGVDLYQDYCSNK